MPTSELPAGTVVVVPFPHSDRLGEKRRPAVVVSGSAVAEAGHVWIAMITSAHNTQAAGDVRIDDSAAAGLGVESAAGRSRSPASNPPGSCAASRRSRPTRPRRCSA